jgi:hypothetical protein
VRTRFRSSARGKSHRKTENPPFCGAENYRKEHRKTYRFATFQPFAIRLDTETMTYNRDDSVDLFVRNAAAPERRRLSPWGSWHVNADLVDETILEVDEVDLLFEI